MNKRFFSFVFALNLLMIGTSVNAFAENLFHPTSNHSNEQTTNIDFSYSVSPSPAVAPLAAAPPPPAPACTTGTCGAKDANGKITYCTGNDECAAFGCYDWLYPGKISGSSTICVGGTAPVMGSTVNTATDSLASLGNSPSSITYQWYVGKDGATPSSVANSDAATYAASVNTGTAGTYVFTRVAKDNPGTATIAQAGTATGSYTLVVVADPTVTITAGKSICYNIAPGALVATPNGGAASTYSYQWQSSAVTAVNWANVTTGVGGTTGTYTPPSLTSSTQYRVVVTQTTSGCAGTSTASTITVNALPVITTQPANTTICTGGSVTLSVAAQAGSGSIQSYAWKKGTESVGTSSSTYNTGALTANTTYTVTITNSNGCTLTSNAAVVTVNPDPTVAITPDNKSICYNTSPGTLTAAPSGGAGSTYSYQWQDGTGNISGATASTYNPGALTATTQYRVVVTQTASGCAGTSTARTITVYPELNPGTVTGAPTICEGGTPSTIDPGEATGGSGTYTYQWYRNAYSLGAGTTSSYTPHADDIREVIAATVYTYTRHVSSVGCYENKGSSGSHVLTVVKKPTVTISSAQTVCAGTTVSALTATVTDGNDTGTSTYTWRWGGTSDCSSGNTTTTTNTYSPGVLSAGSHYYTVSVTQTTSGCASSSATPVLKVVTSPISAGAISGSSTICAGGTPAQISVGTAATCSHGTIKYQWYKDGNSVGTSGTASTYTPPASDATAAGAHTYTRKASTEDCAEVQAAGSYVLNVVNIPTVTITSAEAVCYGFPVSPMTATVIGGNSTGTSTYTWYWGSTMNCGDDYDVTNADTYSPASFSASRYYSVSVKQPASGCTSASATPIYKEVHPEFKPGAIATTGQAICIDGDPSVIGNGTSATGGNGTITYSWYINGSAGSITGAAGATYDPPAGAATATGAFTYTRKAHNSTCNPGGVASTGSWVLTVHALPAQPDAEDQTVCGTGNNVTVPLTASCPTCSNVSFEWWDVATDGSRLHTGANHDAKVNAGTSATYYVNTKMNDAPNCVSARVQVVATVIDNASGLTTPTVDNNTTATCGTGTSLKFTVTNAAALSADEEFVWYNSGGQTFTSGVSGSKNENFDTPATLTPGVYTYYVGTRNKIHGCVTDANSRVQVTATINAIPQQPTPITGQECADLSPATATKVLLAAASSEEPNVTFRWYTQSSGGSTISNDKSYEATVANPVGGNTTASSVYYVEAYNYTTNCVSTPRVPVTAFVNANPTAPTNIATSDICYNSTSPLIFTASGSSSNIYDWSGSDAGGVIVGTDAYQYPSTSAPNTYTVKVKSQATYSNGLLSATPNVCYSTEEQKSGVIYALPTAPTAITTDPANGQICTGETITFTATLVAGYGYDWSNSTPSLSQATNSSYVVGGSVNAAGGATITPRVQATETHGASLVCKSAVYTGTPIVVGTTPARPELTSVTSRADTSVCAATDPSITLEVSNGVPGVTYRWYKNNSSSSITGETGYQYAATATGSYTVEAVNGHCESIKSPSRFIRITPVSEMPGNVELDLSDGTYREGCGVGSVQLSVKTPVSSFTSYQWYKNGVAITSGATLSTFSVQDLGQATYTV
ncbi:MAG: hypothetical protein LBF81_07260, partial [Prevotellaceae bacterium]|nr:hypothetical protein [Prevotellaceae bacterium]